VNRPLLFSERREEKAAASLLKVIFDHCQISPYDARLTYPDGATSLSSLDVLLDFFVRGTQISQRPPDAPRFVRFLKGVRFSSKDLASVQVN
jgi:hypothetical protein